MQGSLVLFTRNFKLNDILMHSNTHSYSVKVKVIHLATKSLKSPNKWNDP